MTSFYPNLGGNHGSCSRVMSNEKCFYDMTVTYTYEVASCKGFGCFWKLLFRWKGSIYKLVWPDLFLYTTLYYIIRLVYQFGLNPSQRKTFEKVSEHCEKFTDLIPVSFVLGFYVSIVVQRWWAQYEYLPWPDSLALFVSTSIHGFMTSSEKKIFDDLNSKTSHPMYWMPLVWAGAIVARARKEGRIRDDFAVKTIIDAINTFRGMCGGLLSYDWISIPLVYTQVVTLAVYSFFVGTLIGRQFVGVEDEKIDLFVPWFTLLQFFFYMGWLKVAESLVNPFGEDDDDFEISYLIVDEMHSEHPELIQDIYWEEVVPQELPYTIASEQFKREPPQGSTVNLEVPEMEQEFLPMLEEIEEERNSKHEDALGKVLNSGATHAINIKDMGDTRSASSSVSALGSYRSGGFSRKPSAISMLLSRVFSSNMERERRERRYKTSGLPLGSKNSLTCKRPRKSHCPQRSTSRLSSISRFSPGSMPRNQTNTSVQDCEVFRMSGESLEEDPKSPCIPPLLRKMYSDDDDPIIIKIKNRDGNVINTSVTEEPESFSSSSRACLIRKSRRSSRRTKSSIKEDSPGSSDKDVESEFSDGGSDHKPEAPQQEEKEKHQTSEEKSLSDNGARKRKSILSSSMSQSSFSNLKVNFRDDNERAGSHSPSTRAKTESIPSTAKSTLSPSHHTQDLLNIGDILSMI
ncbi:Bestrophin-2 [Armadillidium vulgare]|nr:Bestrophin-2 [Armadillidium vulgare]